MIPYWNDIVPHYDFWTKKKNLKENLFQDIRETKAGYVKLVKNSSPLPGDAHWIHNLKKIQFENSFLDCYIHCSDGVTVLCSKVLLATVSNFFCKILQECADDEIATLYLPDFPSIVVNGLVEMIYNGETTMKKQYYSMVVDLITLTVKENNPHLQDPQMRLSQAMEKTPEQIPESLKQTMTNCCITPLIIPTPVMLSENNNARKETHQPMIKVLRLVPGEENTGDRDLEINKTGVKVECQMETSNQKTVTFEFNTTDIVPEDMVSTFIREDLLAEDHRTILVEQLKEIVTQLPNNLDKLPPADVGVSDQTMASVPVGLSSQFSEASDSLAVTSETDAATSNSNTVHSTKSLDDCLGEPVKQSTPVVTPDKSQESSTNTAAPAAAAGSRFAVKKVEDLLAVTGSDEPELTALSLSQTLNYQRAAAEAEHYNSSPSPRSCYDTTSESVEPDHHAQVSRAPPVIPHQTPR